MPSTKRPGAAEASDAADWAIRAGPRVKAGRIAVPSRKLGAHTDASARVVRPSKPLDSDDQTSV